MKLLILWFLLFPLILLSQEYSEIVQVEGKTSNELYVSAREWFAKTFVSANDVIQMDDARAGKLIGKGNFDISESYVAPGMVKTPIIITFLVDFTMTVATKDGRYKCDMDNFFVQPDVHHSTYKAPKTTFAEILKDKEYYKNASDPDWLFANQKASETKISRLAARNFAPVNKAYYNFIVKTEDKVTELMKSLEDSMKASEETW